MKLAKTVAEDFRFKLALPNNVCRVRVGWRQHVHAVTRSRIQPDGQ